MFDDDKAGCGSRRVPGHRILRGRAVRLATAGAAALLLGPMALAAQASAAKIAPNRACYVNDDPAKGAPMTITGTGFIPGAPVQITGTDVSATTTAAASGAISARTTAPILATIDPASRRTTLTATDETDPAITATTVVSIANLAVSTNPASVKNLHKDKVKFAFSGFTPGKTIYGFYARKKIVATERFGKAKGACGMLTTRALLYPGGHPKFDQYTLTFESASKYSRKANPRVTGKLTIFKL